jgi:hypothetical protein
LLDGADMSRGCGFVTSHSQGSHGDDDGCAKQRCGRSGYTVIEAV